MFLGTVVHSTHSPLQTRKSIFIVRNECHEYISTLQFQKEQTINTVSGFYISCIDVLKYLKSNTCKGSTQSRSPWYLYNQETNFLIQSTFAFFDTSHYHIKGTNFACAVKDRQNRSVSLQQTHNLLGLSKSLYGKL